MRDGNKCESCNEVVEGIRAQHKQTKYCHSCAKIEKLKNTRDSWHPEDRKDYMREYMVKYRSSHPKLSHPYVLKHREQKRKKSEASSPDQNTNYLLCLWFIPLLFLSPSSSETMDLWYDSVKTVITYLELIVLKITSLAFIVVVCGQHIRHMLERSEKTEKVKELIKSKGGDTEIIEEFSSIH